jgi:hypothetical protein
MSEGEGRGLQRLNLDKRLPTGFNELTKDEQCEVIKRLMDQDIELRKELLQKVGKSQIAEHDLAVAIETVQRLDHERKIYSEHVKGETGSGTYDLKIKGGDTKFLVPILAVIGVIIVVMMLILRK